MMAGLVAVTTTMASAANITNTNFLCSIVYFIRFYLNSFHVEVFIWLCKEIDEIRMVFLMKAFPRVNMSELISCRIR